MKFHTYFKFTSYAVVSCGSLALLVSEGIGVFVALIFAVALIGAWYFEGTQWQITERAGLALIILSMPLFYVDWQYQAANLSREKAGATTLAHLILGLSVIKLLQVKNDRDWVFLYLISFFEVLLAAGLSISPLFLAVLGLYLLSAACTIIAFEVNKAERNVKIIGINNYTVKKGKNVKPNSIKHFPIVATVVLMMITLLAIPMFFVMPRVGSAGLGSEGKGLSGFIGFSDSVNLGVIAKLQENNQVVMRVRVNDSTAVLSSLRWRGVALDTFDNKGWRNSKRGNNSSMQAGENGLIKLGTVERAENLSVQTIYLEPIDTQILFAPHRVVAIQGSFAKINKDTENALSYYRTGLDRINYKVFFDITQPDEQVLRVDKTPYSTYDARYLQLPSKIDSRIEELAQDIIYKSEAKNRYDIAKAIETHLQSSYGYTLDLKANGNEPLADFLFNVREGHCEYFATAMAVMLRTQGIATRIVNGFHSGDYNDAAKAYIVTQRQAHSWVEVYFPESDSWVTFDPTPAAGRDLGQDAAFNPIAARVRKYLEALEMFWLQYVVSYDNQEQKSLARSLRNKLMQNQEDFVSSWTSWQEYLNDWWRTIKGQYGTAASFKAIIQIATGLLLFLILFYIIRFLVKRLWHSQFWNIINSWRKQSNSTKCVEFYERMTRALAKRGIRREAQQTPLEFASELAVPEVILITEAYNRARFSNQQLQGDEFLKIEGWLQQLEQ